MSSRGPRAGTCQIKDATSFLKEIHTGQASSLMLWFFRCERELEPEVLRKRKGFLKLAQDFCIFPDSKIENEVKFLAWTIGTFSCKQFSLVGLLFARLQIQRETMLLNVDQRKINQSFEVRCSRFSCDVAQEVSENKSWRLFLKRYTVRLPFLVWCFFLTWQHSLVKVPWC